MHREQIKLFFCTFKVVALILIFLLQQATQLLSQDKDGLQVNKFLEMSFEELMNVELITAGKRPEVINEIPASVVVISRDEIKKYGYRNLQEILENVPGYYVIDQYAHTDVTLGVRGFWSPSTKGVIIMVNGINQMQDVYTHFPLNKVAVPVEAIDRIEIIRGPMSVIYGSGAFYGAINIITNDFKKNKSKSTVSASYGTNNNQKIIFRVVGSDNDFRFSANGSFARSEGQNIKWNKMSSNPYFGNKTTKNFFENSSHYFNLSGSYKEFYGNFTIIRDNKPWIFLWLDLNNPNRKISDFATVRLGHRKKIDKLEWDLKFGYYSTNIQSGNTFSHDPIIEPHYDYSHWALGSQSFDIDINTFYTPSDKFNITSGIFYRRLLQRYELLNMPSIPFNDVVIRQPYDVNLQNYAVFGQANYKFSNKIDLVAGLRLEKISKGKIIWEVGYGHDLANVDEPYSRWDLPMDASKVQFIPRLAVIYSLYENSIMKFLYGKAVRMPAYHEINDVVLYPNENPIEPEAIHTFELNYISSLSKRLTINLSIYRNILENLIYRKEWMDGDNYRATTTNEGEMNTNGLEIVIKAKPVENLQLDLSLTYQDTEDQNNPERNVMCSPQILAYGKLAWNILPDFHIAFTSNYVDRMSAQWDISKINPRDNTFGKRIGKDTPAYLNLGINVRVDNLFRMNGLFVNCRISNILNQEIRYPTYSHSVWADKGTRGIKRFFLITVGKNF
ncbi:TonB-dependent receptor [bacterium]|nr:TonB-dependent receptor [bacterium]